MSSVLGEGDWSFRRTRCHMVTVDKVDAEYDQRQLHYTRIYLDDQCEALKAPESCAKTVPNSIQHSVNWYTLKCLEYLSHM